MQHGNSTGRRDALSVVVAQLVLLLSSLAVQSLLAWLLLPDGRGIYAILAVLGALMPALCSFGLDRSIQYQFMSGRINLGAALGTMLLTACTVSFVAVLVATLVAGVGPLRLFGESRALWYGGLALIACTCGSMFMQRLLMATKRFRAYLTVSLVQALTNIALLVVLVGVLELGTAAAVAALAASYGIGAAVSVVWLNRTVDRLTLVPTRQVPALFRYASKYYPAVVGHSVDFNAGILILGLLATTHDVGLFAAIWSLMIRFLILAVALQETVLPRVAADGVGRPALVAQLSRISVASTALITLTFCVVSKPVLALLLSPPFAEAAHLTWWIAPGLILHASSALLMPYFEGTNRPGVVSLAIWAGLLSNVSFIVLLYPRMGLAGAAFALSLGMAIRFTFLAVEFSRSSGVSWRGMIVMGMPDARLLLGPAGLALKFGAREK